MTQKSLQGSCLCGAVRFELLPPIRDVIVCHCRQCAKWTGYAVAATAVAPENLKIKSGSGEIEWYASSGHAERGFCRICGSSLFWKPAGGARVSVLAGALEPPTGLVINAHIFVANKSDYDDVSGNAPQFPGSAGALAEVTRRKSEKPE